MMSRLETVLLALCPLNCEEAEEKLVILNS